MHRLLSLLALLLVAAPAWAQADAADIEALVAAYHETDRFNGSVLVSDAGETVWEGGVGLASAELRVPNTAETRFRVGSVTKQFTAALVLQLMEEGLVDLHVPASTYIDGVDLDDRITTHHLLTHTSGVHSYTSLPDLGEFMVLPHTPAELMARVADLPLDFEPGEGWAYNNSGYVLLGMIVEAVTGESFADALHARIVEPLGLTETAYDDGVTVFPNAASGYGRGSRGWRQADYLDPSVPYAAGMIRASMGDLQAWSDALFAGEVFEDPATLALMNAPHAPIPGQDGTAYGYGVFVGTVDVGGREVPFVQHGGGINGFTTSFWRLTDRDAVLAASSNTQDGSDALVRGLAALLYGDAPELPLASAADALREAYVAGGVAAVEAAFAAARADDGVEVTEFDLNTLGYAVLGDGATEDAVAIFRLNVAAYPDAWNPNDSLGEALLELGDTEGAIASYRRAHELDPGAGSPRAALEALGVDLDEVVVPEAVLARYVGAYEIQPGFVLTVTREGDRLFAQATGQPRLALNAISETEFAPAEVPARLTFEPGDPSPATTLAQGGREMRAPRIDG